MAEYKSQYTGEQIDSAIARANEAIVGIVTRDDVDFISKHPSTNLFNKDTMVVTGSWYAWAGSTQGEGGEVVLKANQYTTDYGAIEIPITNAGDYTIHMGGGCKLYGYFFTDNNNICTASYARGLSVKINEGYTITAPAGASKLLLCITIYQQCVDGGHNLMVSLGNEVLTYEPYTETHVLDGVDVDIPEVYAMASVVGTDGNTVKLMLPEKYHLVVGDTFELFYKGVVNAVNPDLFDVHIICDKGSAYSKRFIWQPTASDVGTHNMTVELYGINHNLLHRKNVGLVVKNKATSPASAVNVLCVGDSLTTGGQWPVEVHRRLTANNGTPTGDGLTNINFVGTRQKNGVGYEGYGGWRFDSYLTANVNTNSKIITCTHDKVESVDQHSVYADSTGAQWKIEAINADNIHIIAISGEGSNFPASGTLTWVSGGANHSNIVYTASENAPGNPFWNAATGKLDIAAYAARIGVEKIDYVYVLLGWNMTSKTEAEYKDDAEDFVQKFRSYNSNIKIVYMGLQLPARDGLAVNYGASDVYANYYGRLQRVFDIEKWYNDLKSSFPDHLSVINIAGQFDTEHNMPTSTRTVNVRSTETETYQTNGLHPANAGYMQIADAVYRDLTHKLQD